ncbi:MAG: hypothetical protein FWG93_05995 [Oscillospiraceae bacterium]|nr:hypothetical protein [Oscillospiraceae bacterium]
MPVIENIVAFAPDALHARVAEHFRRRHSLIEIREAGGQLSYTFDKGLSIECVRVPVPESRTLDSIRDVYTFAGYFENNLAARMNVKFS